MSTVTESQPALLYISALKALGMASHPFTTALPAFHASLTLFAIAPLPLLSGCYGRDARTRPQMRQTRPWTGRHAAGRVRAMADWTVSSETGALTDVLVCPP